jgi:hypothetical protein
MPEVIYWLSDDERDRIEVQWKGGWWMGVYDVTVQQNGVLIGSVPDTKLLINGYLFPLPGGGELYVQLTDWGVKMQRNGQEMRHYTDPIRYIHAAQLLAAGIGYAELLTAGLISFIPEMIVTQGFIYPGAPVFPMGLLAYLLVFIITGALLLIASQRVVRDPVPALIAGVVVFWAEMLLLYLQVGVSPGFVVLGLAFSVVAVLTVRMVRKGSAALKAGRAEAV